MSSSTPQRWHRSPDQKIRACTGNCKFKEHFDNRFGFPTMSVEEKQEYREKVIGMNLSNLSRDKVDFEKEDALTVLRNISKVEYPTKRTFFIPTFLIHHEPELYKDVAPLLTAEKKGTANIGTKVEATAKSEQDLKTIIQAEAIATIYIMKTSADAADFTKKQNLMDRLTRKPRVKENAKDFFKQYQVIREEFAKSDIFI